MINVFVMLIFIFLSPFPAKMESGNITEYDTCCNLVKELKGKLCFVTEFSILSFYLLIATKGTKRNKRVVYEHDGWVILKEKRKR